MFYERKNFPGLIQAFNFVAEKYPNVVLRIFGDGPDRIKVEQAKDASPFKDRIKIPGKISHAEVLQQMQDADIFALIGWREPFATVFLEAMAAGLPLIACNDGGIAEVIHSVDVDAPALDAGRSALDSYQTAKP
jgi:glycosyltransferase involved in cell wall biosynthesis